MQNLANPHFRQGFAGAPGRELPNSDDPVGGERTNDFSQMIVTNCVKPLPLGPEKLVRRAIAAGIFQESEWAIILDEMFSEESLGPAKSSREKRPEARAADFAARATETEHETFGVFVRGRSNLRLDFQPVADRRNFTERNPGLRHAEGTGIHSQKENPLGRRAEAPQVLFVRRPSVTQRVINVRNRRSEAKFVCRECERARGTDQFVTRAHGATVANNCGRITR